MLKSLFVFVFAIGGAGLLGYWALRTYTPELIGMAYEDKNAPPEVVLAQRDSLDPLNRPEPARSEPSARPSAEPEGPSQPRSETPPPPPPPPPAPEPGSQITTSDAAPAPTTSPRSARAGSASAAPAQTEQEELASAANDDQLAACAQTGTWGAGNCPTLDQLIERFSRAGSVAFTDPPTQMTVGQKYIVRAAASVGSTGATEAVREAAGDGAAVTTQQANLLPTLEANLDGEGFRITPMQRKASQTLLTNQPTEWAWEVTPMQEGARQLTLIVWGSVQVRDVQPVRVQTIRHSVTVDVDLGGRVAQAGDWVLGHWDAAAGITGLGIAGIAWFRRRRKAAAAAQA